MIDYIILVYEFNFPKMFLFFVQAVIKRLMTDVPFGVLLSGGLDSSLVAAVASRYLVESEAACQWGSQLHTFCIGLKVILSDVKKLSLVLFTLHVHVYGEIFFVHPF